MDGKRRVAPLGVSTGEQAMDELLVCGSAGIGGFVRIGGRGGNQSTGPVAKRVSRRCMHYSCTTAPAGKKRAGGVVFFPPPLPWTVWSLFTLLVAAGIVTSPHPGFALHKVPLAFWISARFLIGDPSRKCLR